VPESRDEQMDPRTDVAGAVLGALGLAGITYALVAAGEQGVSGAVLLTGVLGVVALAAFVLVEQRSSHPRLPLDVFASRQFTAANLVTFAVYAALAGVFFLLVLQLQISAGFSPLAAGVSLLPVTVALLLLSSRAGALSSRLGPRLPMTVGPLLCAVATVLLARIGPGASYVVDVLPGVVLFGLGLAATVAPLTVTVLAAADDRHAGVASGVNNAVARTAGLLAVAVLPVVAGITGADYTDAALFTDGFRIAALLSAGLLALGGVLAWLTISNEGVRHAA
jgi:predicted MFS family arabinose efflux permease